MTGQTQAQQHLVKIVKGLFLCSIAWQVSIVVRNSTYLGFKPSDIGPGRKGPEKEG